MLIENCKLLNNVMFKIKVSLKKNHFTRNAFRKMTNKKAVKEKKVCKCLLFF